MNSFPNAKKHRLIATYSLFALALAIICGFSLQPAMGQESQLYIQLTPASGPVGTPVAVYGLGFSGGSVSISFNSQQVGTAYPQMFGRINGMFTVPSVSFGSYTVTATASTGSSASATFTVTAKVTTPAPGTATNTGTTTGTGTSTTPGTNSGTSSPAGAVSIALSATSGNVGKPVTVTGSGFGAGSFVTINFASTYVAATTADSSGNINIGFTVPMENPGFYTVSATTSQGVYTSQSFYVTSGAGSTSNPSTGSTSGGFWTGLNILAVGLVVAAAVIIPVTFVYMRRGKNEPHLEQEQHFVQPQTPSYSRTSPPTSTYNKPASIASRYDQFASYGRQTSHAPPTTGPYASQYSRSSVGSSSYSGRSSEVTRRPTIATSHSPPIRSNPQPANTVVCRHCRQTVRADYNICPYCRKKLR